ncbi:MAG: hypothetical protein AMXMBFR7_48110 [Planctomycetota bacterium]
MRQRNGGRNEEDEEKEGGGWGWFWLVVIIVGFLYFRTGGYSHTSQADGEGGFYRTFESENYEPGSVGYFWANEERAARGVPGAVASPGLVYTSPPTNSGLGQIQVEQSAATAQQQERMLKLLEQQQAEMERMRNEIERLRNTKQVTEY